ncbi:unnamed protein product [Paramecium sonneborni]|uniref:Uncharacterized protein n=1 Tax=Paramecium sonneborni TaxID=65129 RepID=A0A8S1LRT8_9CILI|nr:unnamed protein product [Paramecium sonneborni]
MQFFKPKYSAFFSEIITKKQFNKCCRYNQDQKSISPIQLRVLYETMKPMNEDYLSEIQFIKDVSKIDSISTKNCLIIQLGGGELITLEFNQNQSNETLMNISQLNQKVQKIIKKEVQAYKLIKQAELIYYELAPTQK